MSCVYGRENTNKLSAALGFGNQMFHLEELLGRPELGRPELRTGWTNLTLVKAQHFLYYNIQTLPTPPPQRVLFPSYLFSN